MPYLTIDKTGGGVEDGSKLCLPALLLGETG